MATKISPAVLDVLRRARLDENMLFLPTGDGRLERTLYVDTDKVLRALGGAWKRKLGGHLFDVEEVKPLIDAVLATGTYVDAKKLFQFFETPPALADELVARLPVAALRRPAGLRVIDPSAGNGALLDALHRRLTRLDIPHDVTQWAAIEPQSACKKVLASKGYQVLACDDFLEYIPSHGAAVLPLDQRYDVCLQNPPFTQGQATMHLSHALEQGLAENYALIQPASFGFRARRAERGLRTLVMSLGGEVFENDPDAFASSGTKVRTLSIIIDGSKGRTRR